MSQKVTIKRWNHTRKKIGNYSTPKLKVSTLKSKLTSTLTGVTSISRSNRMIIQTKYKDRSSKYSFPFSKRDSKILDLAVTRRDSIARLKRNARGCRIGYYRVRDEWSWFLLPTFEIRVRVDLQLKRREHITGLKLPFLLRLIQQKYRFTRYLLYKLLKIYPRWEISPALTD